MKVIFKILFSLLLIGLIPFHSFSQKDVAVKEIPQVSQEIIEDYFNNLDEEGDFDFNTLFENLEFYINSPLNINEASQEDLADLRLLNDLQISNLKIYIDKNGKLQSLYELQAIAGFDLNTIKRIVPFITVNESLKDYYTPFFKMLSSGKSELYLKMRRTLETQKGYTITDTTRNRYLGDPNRLYARYKFTHENRLQYGFTMEKDSGEEFFSGSNATGFDFYSFHFYMRNFNRHIESIAIGDYAINLGQGLILSNAFGAGKSSYVMDIKRTGRVIRPYTAVSESAFLRGAAVNIQLGDKFETAIFYSLKNRDANLQVDTLDGSGEPLSRFSSLLEDGNHRTPSEIARENALLQQSIGGRLKYNHKSLSFSLNFLNEQFNANFQRSDQLYNAFIFAGDELTNVSLDYNYVFKNFNFFGEIAMSDNGATAQIHGLLLGLDKRVSLAASYRNYQRDYQVIFPNPFGETQNGNNERGFYIGAEIKPTNEWNLSIYADYWEHPWFRFGKDGPSKGTEYLAKLSYTKKRKYEYYIQFFYERKQQNNTNPELVIDQLEYNTRKRFRIHLSHKVNKSLELRNRIEYSYNNNSQGPSKGFLIYQDILYRKIESPFSFTARYALFQTDDFNSRIYAYENDIIYEFFIPFFFYRGSRAYINTRYDINRNLTAEFRIAQTFLSNQETISSGLNEIDGPRRTEIKAQLRFKF